MPTPFLSLGCPAVDDYLQAREQNATYNPVDVSGFAKLVFDVQNKQLVIHWSDGTQTGFGLDTKKVLVSTTDTTEGYLGDKIVAGAGVNVSVLNAGLNEQIEISATGSPPAGVNGSIQFNDNLNHGGTDLFVWDNTNNRMTIWDSTKATNVNVYCNANYPIWDSNKNVLFINSIGNPPDVGFAGSQVRFATGTAPVHISAVNVQGSPYMAFAVNLGLAGGFTQIDPTQEAWGFIVDGRPAVSSFKVVWLGASGGTSGTSKMSVWKSGSFACGDNLGANPVETQGADRFFFDGVGKIAYAPFFQPITGYKSTAGNNGISQTIQITDATGTHTLVFEDGLLVNYTLV